MEDRAGDDFEWIELNDEKRFENIFSSSSILINFRVVIGNQLTHGKITDGVTALEEGYHSYHREGESKTVPADFDCELLCTGHQLKLLLDCA